MVFLLVFINIFCLVIMYLLNETIAALQRQNNKLIGDLQVLNNEILYLKEQSNLTVTDSVQNVDTYSNMLGVLTVLSVVILGFTVLIFLKNDTNVIAELSKNNIKATGAYVKEVIVPSMELLTKSSEMRINANFDNTKSVITETGKVLTKHITEVNKEGVLCLLNAIKPTLIEPKVPRVLGKISREILNYIP